MDNVIKATVKVKVSDMFCFFMYYSYASVSGITGLLFSIGSLVLLFYMWRELTPAYIFLLVVCAALFTIVNPLMLYKRAKKQVANSPAFKEPMEYAFDDNGISMHMGEENATLKWSELCKVRKVCGRYLFYVNHIRANVVPESSIEGGKEAAKKLDAMIKKTFK